MKAFNTFSLFVAASMLAGCYPPVEERKNAATAFVTIPDGIEVRAPQPAPQKFDRLPAVQTDNAPNLAIWAGPSTQQMSEKLIVPAPDLTQPPPDMDLREGAVDRVIS